MSEFWIDPPSIDLRVEVDNECVPMGSGKEIAGPTDLKLFLRIQSARGWMLDIVRNGVTETAHSSRIEQDRFAAELQIPIRTSSSYRVVCRGESGAMVVSDSVAFKLPDNPSYRFYPERRRLKGLIQPAAHASAAEAIRRCPGNNEYPSLDYFRCVRLNQLPQPSLKTASIP